MSHFCSLVQVMLLHSHPHSQGCCVIQELSVFGLFSVTNRMQCFSDTPHMYGTTTLPYKN